MAPLKHWYRVHKKLTWGLLVLVCITPVVLVVIGTLVIGSYKQYVLANGSTTHTKVGIVLGSGITKDGKPFKELQGRLDVAAQALQDGRVDKLILSGDNRFPGYNEPEAMKNYLVTTKHISAKKLQADYAGRSTYESCERARKVFEVEHTIIFSARSHLPRAIFICRHFGIEAYGIASDYEANNAGRREPLANVKALFNVYVRGESTVLGPPIQL